MKKKASLREIIDILMIQNEEQVSYLNKYTNEVVSVLLDDFRIAEEEDSIEGYQKWQQDDIDLASDILADENYLPLPAKRDVNEYNMIENFCLGVNDSETRDELCRAIRGNGAFRRFKQGIERYRLEEAWYKYRDEAMRQLAIEWCQENQIEYEEF